jgi:hypothetical protein
MLATLQFAAISVADEGTVGPEDERGDLWSLWILTDRLSR